MPVPPIKIDDYINCLKFAVAEWEMRHGGSGNGHSGTAADFYESEPAARERPSRHGGGGGGRRITRPQELREQQQSGGGGGGYGSDGSVETLSVNSAQSMQNRLASNFHIWDLSSRAL